MNEETIAHLEAIVAELNDMRQRRDSRLLAPALLFVASSLYATLLTAGLMREEVIRADFEAATEGATTPVPHVDIKTEAPGKLLN